MILTHVVDVYREKKNGSNTQIGLDTKILSGLKLNIQPASNESIVVSEGAFGKTYTAYGQTSTSGIMESDKIVTISGTRFAGRNFIVKGKKNWIVGGPLDHMEFTLFESNE